MVTVNALLSCFEKAKRWQQADGPARGGMEIPAKIGWNIWKTGGKIKVKNPEDVYNVIHIIFDSICRSKIGNGKAVLSSYDGMDEMTRWFFEDGFVCKWEP